MLSNKCSFCFCTIHLPPTEEGEFLLYYVKNFWKDNKRFADLFNACFFDENPKLNLDDLTEVDTDVSSLLQFHGYAETVKRIVDVVKKSAYGVDFVILGIENQSKIHYAMPLRHMRKSMGRSSFPN